METGWMKKSEKMKKYTYLQNSHGEVEYSIRNILGIYSHMKAWTKGKMTRKSSTQDLGGDPKGHQGFRGC